MMTVFTTIVPLEYQETEKRFLHYLKSLPDKVYNKDVPTVSQYKVQIKKDCKGVTIVNHQHYKTIVLSRTWKQIEEMIKHHFKSKAVVLTDEQKAFVLDLRF